MKRKYLVVSDKLGSGIRGQIVEIEKILEENVADVITRSGANKFVSMNDLRDCTAEVVLKRVKISLTSITLLLSIIMMFGAMLVTHCVFTSLVSAIISLMLVAIIYMQAHE